VTPAKYIGYTHSLGVRAKRQPVAQPQPPFAAAKICGQTNIDR